MSAPSRRSGGRVARLLALGGAGLAAALLATAGLWREPAASAQEKASGSQVLTAAQMEGFIVQAPNALPGADIAGLQNADDAVVWRRHDWPGHADAAARPDGYQASDSVVETLPDGRLTVQTFDFGDADRRFQRFDLGEGDGGQALVSIGGSVYASLTEDGGGGVQWFVGEACRSESSEKAGLQGWLFFDSDVAKDHWTDRVAHLKIERRQADCPWFFYNDAYTRWRRLDARFPYRVVAPGSPPRQGAFDVDAIVSEHYGGSSIAAASHLERSWFARGFGLLRWERWENADRSSLPQMREDARSLAESGRCGPVGGSVSPGPDWLMVDCRTWTNFVRLPQPWKVEAFNWPRPDALAQFEAAFAAR